MGIAYNTSIVRSQMHLHLDFSNVKSYPGSGTTVTNLKQIGSFTLNNSPVFSNGIMSFDGLNGGSHMSEAGGAGLGSHGTSSFTYQFLINPKSSTSVDDPNTARIYEQTGWPTTYHLLQIVHNGGNSYFNFTGRDTTQSVLFNAFTPGGTAILNKWYLITASLDRSTNFANIYINTTKYQTSFSATLGTIGNASALRMPPTFSEMQADFSCVLGYQRALTDAEVRQNFEALRGRVGI